VDDACFAGIFVGTDTNSSQPDSHNAADVFEASVGCGGLSFGSTCNYRQRHGKLQHRLYRRDTQHRRHGFVRASTGSITSFDPTGSVDTTATGINDKGEIGGYFTDKSNITHGFFRAADGTITTFDAPGASFTAAEGRSAVSKL